MSRRRAGTIVLSHDELHKRLGLPADMKIVSVEASANRQTVEIVVEGVDLPICPDMVLPATFHLDPIN